MRPTRIREIKMKKQLFLASALTIALTSQAQILTPTKTTSDGVGQPIPGMFTCDGKSRMSNYLDYNENGAPDKPCGVGRADANPKLLLNDT